MSSILRALRREAIVSQQPRLKLKQRCGRTLRPYNFLIWSLFTLDFYDLLALGNH